MTLISLDLKTVVKDNVHVGPDYAVVGWMDCNSVICMFDHNPSIIACTRREIISNVLTFSRLSANRTIAQRQTVANVNQKMPHSGRPD
jgi:hypothetical protein